MAYQPLKARNSSLSSKIVLWLTAHGWQYSITPTRGVVLASLSEQIKYKWVVWRMSRDLIAQRRQRQRN